jgi:hypothetical protein
MFELPQINPLHTTAMHFFDFGDIESPDGRSHPLTADTAVRLVTSGDDCSQYAVGSIAWQRCQVQKQVTAGIAGSSAPSQGGSGPTPDPSSGGGIVDKITQAATGKHTPARIAISVLAIGILLIVALRLTK